MVQEIWSAIESAQEAAAETLIMVDPNLLMVVHPVIVMNPLMVEILPFTDFQQINRTAAVVLLGLFPRCLEALDIQEQKFSSKFIIRCPKPKLLLCHKVLHVQ